MIKQTRAKISNGIKTIPARTLRQGRVKASSSLGEAQRTDLSPEMITAPPVPDP
ncbi:Hypothetical protein FKW44_009841 [Caligus rogercresseyi]|uniref:Uncharacterized protein n=1 Tax=Caligus rogercresseyi TaxID=217165 RepID=A0A7T8HG20_CALRO|nr:Hypothetical protein FKW44_009841 [Caligus rogercresseyi]